MGCRFLEAGSYEGTRFRFLGVFWFSLSQAVPIPVRSLAEFKGFPPAFTARVGPVGSHRAPGKGKLIKKSIWLAQGRPRGLSFCPGVRPPRHFFFVPSHGFISAEARRATTPTRRLKSYTRHFHAHLRTFPTKPGLVGAVAQFLSMVITYEGGWTSK